MVNSSIIRKAGAAALALTLGASLLAGCASKSGNSENGGGTQAAGNQTSGNQTQTTTETKADPFGKQPELTVLTRGTWTDPNTKYPDGQSLDDNAYTRMLKDQYNIEIKNEFVASNYQQQVDLAIASGKIPDYLINLTYTEYKAIVKAGLAMDISKVWDEYASDQTKAVYASNKDLFDSLVKQDGKMYGIPASKPLTDFLTVMWIRKDWLDKLGLKPPTNLDELAAVAKAFKEQDPDGDGKADTEGIAGPPTNGPLYQDMDNQNFNFHFDPIFSAFNAFPGFWLKGSDGKAVYGSTLPETKAALQKLADMYKQGLISPGMLTTNTYDLVNNNKAGLFFGTWWEPFVEVGSSWKNDKKANWQAYLLPSGADGIYQAKGGNAAASYAVISKDAKNPEAVIKMLNLYVKGLANVVDKKQQAVLGDYPFPFSQTFSLADGPAKILQEMNKYMAGEVTVDQAHDYFNSYDPSSISIFDKMVAYKTKPYDNTNISGWNFSGDNANDFGLIYSFGEGLQPYVSGKFKWVNTLTYAKTKTMDKRWANLKKLEYETFSKIVVGQKPISDFDTFVQQWKQEGGDQITQEIQESLNQ